ncbi:MAG: ABC transporter ATP-binding protein [Campylobacterota bacterium]|nr:ABC transporter ATP-binding protein [Campylobacterota bacterium]
MIEFIKHYLPYLKQYKMKLFLSFLGMVSVAGTTAAIAYMMKPLLDEVFVEKNVEMLYSLPLLIIAVFALKGLGSFLQAYYMNYVGQDIVRVVRDKMLNHILHMDMVFFYKYHSGELLSRVTNDIGRIQGAVSTHLATFFRESLTAIALLGVVIYQSPSLAFLILIVIPSAYFPVKIISKKLKKISYKSQEKNSELTSNLNETFSNVEIIKAYSTEDFESEKFQNINKSFFKINMKSIKTGELVVPFMELFAAISAAIVIVVGGGQVIDGTMSIGSFFSFLTAMFMAVDPMRRVSVTYSRFQDALAAHDRISVVLDLSAEVKKGSKTLEAIEAIKFDNCSLDYGETKALKNISFDIKKGEKIALVGNSGGGKSSIINLVLRFFDVSSGELKVNGKNIKNFTLSSLREQISIVTQRVYIFNDTIAANIAYGHKIDEEKVITSLKKANIYEYIVSLPDGINTVLNESGTNLSGGQRQRIAIARALYKEPNILILDEATSALDNKSEEEITKTIENISKGIITIIIAHRLKSIRIVDKVYLFKEGSIICEGSQEKLLESCKYFKELYNNEN